MGLSYDIISEFVKITNDKKEKPKEEIVYATIVQSSDGKYVKLDGSDLITPTETTTDIEEGERVTVLIKDHSAIITGNITSPSASGNRVNGIVDVVNEKLGVFETIVADKIDINELNAYKAVIENLIAGKAEIEDLEAVNAKINSLEANDAVIGNLVAGKAEIEDLEAINAKIDNLEANDAVIGDLVAGKAEIGDLKATIAEIKVLSSDFAQIKTLVNGNLTSDNILSFNITADKVTMEDAFIKDAMVDTINADKINAGQINTNAVNIGSADGGMLITGATQQFTDKNGKVRIQIGRDSTGDFTFVLYGEDGKGQIINQNGITASAVGNGLIVNNMINDNAAISGGKLDIGSVITKINEDNSTTIQSNKIFLDQENQSLQVAFGSLKTHVNTIQNESINGTLAEVVDKTQANQNQILVNTEGIKSLVSQNEITKKEISDMKNGFETSTTELSSKYAELSQTLDGFKLEAADTYAKKTTVKDLENNLTTNYATTEAMNSAIDLSVKNINLSISTTYSTKQEIIAAKNEAVSTANNKLEEVISNYWTIEETNTAIDLAKDSIELGVSKIYATKTEAENAATNASNTVKNELLDKIDEATSELVNNSNNILNIVNDILSDDVITPAELENLKIVYTQVVAQKEQINNEYLSYPEDDVAYMKPFADNVNAAFIALETAMSPILLGTQTTGKYQLVQLFTTFYNEYNNFVYIIGEMTKSKLQRQESEIKILNDSVTTVITESRILNDQVTTIQKFMRFTTTGLELFSMVGDNEGRFKVRIDESKLSFMDNNEEIAYLSNQKLNISKAEISDELKIGEIISKRSAKGGMVFK